MVLTKKPLTDREHSCPHCLKGLLVWDERDREPFCFVCGWRNSIHVTPEMAALRRKWVYNELGEIPELQPAAGKTELKEIMSRKFAE